MHKIVNNFKPRYSRVFLSIVLSYIVVLTIPQLTSLITYIKTVQTLEAQSSMANGVMLEQVKRISDENIKGIRQVAYEISMSPYLSNVLNAELPFTVDNRLDMGLLVRNLSTFSNVNSSFIKEFYVYLANSDMIVTSNAMYSNKVFYDNVQNYENMGMDSWSKLILQRNLPESFYPFTNNNRNFILYTRAIPIGYKQTGSIVIQLNEEYIRSLLINIEGTEKSDVYIIDVKGQVVLSTGNNSKLPFEITKLTGSEGAFEATSNRKEYFVSYKISEQNNWKYISVVPKNVLMEKVSYFKILLLAGVFVSFILGIIIAFFFARKNYAPIKGIIKDISKDLGVNLDHSSNEYMLIANTLKKASYESKNLKDAIEAQLPLIKENCFYQLIKGKGGSEDALMKSFKDIDINFEYESFIVVAIQTDDINISKLNINKFFITIYEIIAVAGLYGHLLEEGSDTFILILNVPNVIDEDLKIKLKYVFKQINNCMASISQNTLNIGVGGLKSSVFEVRQSNLEAKAALRYKIIKGYGKVIFFDEIEKEGNSAHYYYPVDVKIQLINALKVADLKGFERTINELYAENFSKREISPDYAQYLFWDIMAIILNVMDDYGIDTNLIPFEECDPMEGLKKCQTVEEMLEYILGYVDSLCKAITSNKKSRNEDLRNRMIGYIEKHYVDEDISLSKIAEELNISASYLSHSFKILTGDNIVNYIAKLRIEKSKEFLGKQKYRIADISKLVGCINSNTFIRLFKKSEGITPGQYREIIGMTQDEREQEYS